MQIWWPDPWQRLADVVAVEPFDAHRRHVARTSSPVKSARPGAPRRPEREPQAAAALPLVLPAAARPVLRRSRPPGPNLTPGDVPTGMVLAAEHGRGRLRAVDLRTRRVQPAVPSSNSAGTTPPLRSNFDGQAGAIRSCEGGRWFRFDDAGGIGAGPIRVLRAMTFGEWIRRYAGLISSWSLLLVIVVLLAPTTAR